MLKLGIYVGIFGFLILFSSHYLWATHKGLSESMFLIGIIVTFICSIVICFSRENPKKIGIIVLLFIGGCFTESQTAWWLRKQSNINFLKQNKPAIDVLILELQKFDKNIVIFQNGAIRYDNKIDTLEHTFLKNAVERAGGYMAVKDSNYIYIGTDGFLDNREGIGKIYSDSLKNVMQDNHLIDDWYVMYGSSWFYY